ncbi:FAD-dependent monooxygenase [Sphingomonas sp. 4RDLI-65]|uniref:FAD-dependent monooxygenase n=1 Tax=Sphingomonas sp. 4RDLI-65 TaxID=3111641 RepID=UPI003C275114
MPSPILIAGAGIGGLAAALALQRQGFRVRLFERTATVGDVGAGIALGATASRSLYSLGLEQALTAVSDRPQASAAFDYRTGEVLGGAFARRNWSAADLVDVNMLHRADLFAVLRAAVDANDRDAIQLDCSVVGFEQTAEDATILLADGRRFTGQALLGCDGLRSTVRTQMLGAGEPRKTGRVAYRFLVPIEDAAPFMGEWTAGIYVGSRVALARYMIRKGSVVNCVAFAHAPEIEDEDWSAQATREELLALFKGWNANVVGLASCAPLERTARWALYDRDPLDVWTDGRVGLLGDSAHAVLPFLGFGAALAIEDAIVLGRAFATGAGPQAALNLYERARRDRANAILLESRRQGEIFDAGPGGAPEIAAEDRESRKPYDALTAELPVAA